MEHNLGFRIVGSPKGGKRRLVNLETAYRAYACLDDRCDLNTESYLSAFWYDAAFSNHLNRYSSVEGFSGYVGPRGCGLI